MIENIYTLISSLSKAEKRIFKINNAHEKIPDYIKAFNFIDKTPNCDDEILKQKFKNEKFVTRLPTLKSYLRAKILQSLRDLQSNKNVEQKALDLIANAKILHEKLFIESALRELEKAKHIIDKYQLINIRSYYAVVYCKLLIAARLNGFSKKALVALLNDMQLREEESLKYNKYLRLYVEMAFHVCQMSNEVMSFYRNVQLENYDFEWEKAPDGDVSLRLLHCNIKYAMAGVLGSKHDKARLDAAMKMIEIYDENTFFKEKNPQMYANAIQMLINLAVRIQRYDLAQIYIEKLEDFVQNAKKMTSYQQQNQIYLLLDCKLQLYHATQQHLKLLTLEKEIEAISITDNKYVNVKKIFTFYFYISSTYFKQANYQKAIYWTHKILYTLKYNKNHQFLEAILIIHLLAHYELGNHKYWQSELVKRKRHIKNSVLETVFITKVFKLLQALIPSQLNIHKPALENFNKQFKQTFEALNYMNEIEDILEKWIAHSDLFQ